MAWADPLGDLRMVLADGPTDNLIKNKILVGPCNGQNRTFFTFEDRLVASGNQSVCGDPVRVFLNAVEVLASGILVTDQIRGEMQLMLVPSGTQTKLTASYHYQQHLDSELAFYLKQAANRVTIDTPGNIPPGLQAAALNYAGELAHRRLAQRWQQRKSQQFMLQDEPARKEAEDLIKYHQGEADAMLKNAGLARRDYYDLRQDRGRAGAFTWLVRVPGLYTPRR